MSTLMAIPIVLATAWVVLGLVAIAAVTRRRPRLVSSRHVPALTILKPLSGADPGLEQNLETFFRQEGVALELLFGVARDDDPSVSVVRRLAARYPHVPSRLVVTGEPGRKNPKVHNLAGMLPHARNDLCLVADSNVRAPAHYASEAVAQKTEGVGIVSHLFTGHGGPGLGATLETTELSGFCAAGVALPTFLGEASLVGKSFLFSRAELDACGGFRALEGVLAEDYVMGRMFAERGLRVVLAPTVLENAVGSPSLRAFVDRHLRWSMMRFRLRPFWFCLEPLTSPLAIAPFAFLAFGGWGLAYALALALARDVGGHFLLRGRSGLARVALGSLPREIAFLAIHLVTPWKRHVAWRGRRMRLGPKTTLLPAR